MGKYAEKACELFAEGANCAQAVFAAFADEAGLDEDFALKLSSSFGGGMGRLREVCGAVSGMFMVAGVLYGYDRDDGENKKVHYTLIQDMAKKFTEKHETIICRDLLKLTGKAVSPVPTVRNEEFYKVRPCVRFVESAALILEELIEEKENQQ